MANLIANLYPGSDVSCEQHAEQGIALALESRPDLILLDLQMPGVSGFEALATLAERLPATPVVIVSGSLNASDMQRALNEGAMGFIPKSAEYDIVKNALKLVVSGGIYVPPEMLALFGGRQPPVAQNAVVDVKSPMAGKGQSERAGDVVPSCGSEVLLTPRQQEVLSLLCEGQSNKEIARVLDCADTTVKAHVTAIFKELRARNRTEAVVNAQRLGLI